MLSSFYLQPKHVMSECAKICLAQGLAAPEPMCSLARGTRREQSQPGHKRGPWQQDGD